MNELIQNAVILSSPLLSLGALAIFPEASLEIPLVVILALISLLLPIGLGVCSIAELPLLIQYTGHFQDGLIVVLIILLGTNLHKWWNRKMAFVKMELFARRYVYVIVPSSSNATK